MSNSDWTDVPAISGTPRKRFTLYGATFLDSAPRLEGWEAFFVSRFGADRTTWTYRPVPQKETGQ